MRYVEDGSLVVAGNLSEAVKGYKRYQCGITGAECARLTLKKQAVLAAELLRHTCGVRITAEGEALIADAIEGATEFGAPERPAQELTFRQALATLPTQAVRVLVAQHAQMNMQAGYLSIPKSCWDATGKWEAGEHWQPVLDDDGKQIDTQRYLRLTFFKDFTASEQARADIQDYGSRIHRLMTRCKNLEKSVDAETNPSILLQYSDQLADARREIEEATAKLEAAKATVAAKEEVIWQWPIEECA